MGQQYSLQAAQKRSLAPWRSNNSRNVVIPDNVPEGRHIYIVGRSGMGKTTLTKALINKKVSLYPYYNVYHVDTKHRGDYSEDDGELIISHDAPMAYTTGGNRMVWQPMGDDKEQYDLFFNRILNAGVPGIVNIDETKNMVFGSISNIPRELGLLLYQGRLPGISVYGGTQEVYQSPRAIESQSSDIISFDVTNKYDVSMIRSYLELEPSDTKGLGLLRFQFYHRDKDAGKTRLYNSYRDFVTLIKS